MTAYDVCTRDGHIVATFSSIEKTSKFIKKHYLLKLTYSYRDIRFIEWLLLKVVFA